MDPSHLRNTLFFPALQSGELKSTDGLNTPLGDSHHLLMAPWHTAYYLHSGADKLGMEMPSGLHG